MELVEIYRYRWWVAWWTAGFLLVAVPIALLINHTTVDMNGATIGPGGAASSFTFGISNLAPIAMFLAMVFATTVGLSLNRESETRALSWTKPISRVGIALRIFAVDIALVLAMYAIAWVVMLGVIAFAHLHAVIDPQLGTSLLLTIGVAVMWYGAVEALTSGLAPNGKGIVGFLWPAAIVVGALHGQFGDVATRVIAFINVFNPLAYSSTSVNTNGTSNTFWEFPAEERALVVWLFALAYCTLATLLWTRREA